MRSQDIAALIAAGTKPSAGDQDISLHQGVVKSWDRQTGVNTVDINGTILNNLDSLQGGIPNAYSAGDVVLVARKQSRYFLLGKVASAAGLAGSAPAFQTSTADSRFSAGLGGWQSFPSGITPSVSTYIGSNRTALILWQCSIDADDGQGEVGFQTSGASSVAPAAFTGMTVKFGTRRFNAGTTDIETYGTVSGSYLMGAGAGLQFGFNTFTMQIRPSVWNSGYARFYQPGITVIPL